MVLEASEPFDIRIQGDLSPVGNLLEGRAYLILSVVRIDAEPAQRLDGKCLFRAQGIMTKLRLLSGNVGGPVTDIAALLSVLHCIVWQAFTSTVQHHDIRASRLLGHMVAEELEQFRTEHRL